jgi:hypothetical protein
MNKLLMLAALIEVSTGLILLAYPPIVVRLLLDLEIAGAGVVMSRLAGIALIGLGAACWPNTGNRSAFYGILTYSMMAMLYLIAGGYRPCDPERSSGRRVAETTKDSVHIGHLMRDAQAPAALQSLVSHLPAQPAAHAIIADTSCSARGGLR